MKIIGKNSLAFYFSLLLKIFSICYAIFAIYFFIGYNICKNQILENQKIINGPFISDFFVYQNEKIPTYQINLPLTNVTLFSGPLNGVDIYITTIGFLSSAFYFWCLFKIFKGLSEDRIFNSMINRWLSVFAVYNLFFTVAYLLFWISLVKMINPLTMVFAFFPFILITVITIFVRLFFKKGYELQTENDLTI